jgi:3D (Asp-Asp-Asp) domain-containing protein
VQVTATNGGLTAGTNYFVRSLGGGAYALYDSAANAKASPSTAGRINLAGNVTAGILKTADRSFPTGTLVQVTATGGGLVADTNYFIRNLGAGAYSFFSSTLDATAGSAVTTGLIALSGEIAAGIFSPTAKGRDTDGDGLDDRFEALIGWTVTTPQRTYQAYSSPNRADSNFDAPLPGVDSDGDGIEDRVEYSGSDLFAAPAAWEDKRQDTNNDGVIDDLDAPPNGLRDRFEISQLPASSGETDYVLDPLRKDTDGDGIDDGTEIIGYKITPITGAKPFWVSTNPTNPFTDSDTFSDGLERMLGLDPTNGADTDADGDGLPDLVETIGWTVYSFGVSTTGYVQGAYAPGFDRHVTPTSTDIFTDAVRFTDAADPNVPRFALVQVAGGGLTPTVPYYLGRLVAQPDPNSVQYGLYLTATDAAAGISKGLVDLTSDVTDVQLAREFNNVTPASTDQATDSVKFALANDPKVSASTLVQITGGGLNAATNYYLGRLISQPDPATVRYGIYLSPSAAAAGTAGGSVHLTSDVISIRLPAQSHKSSLTNSVDSDGDGLTDYEEFFLGTDPMSADSDHDGIDDRTEYLGYTLGHDVGGMSLGIIKTNPLDADTDNDKRSDGAEAELTDVEQSRWVVRVVGQTPYRVYSNPLVADSDFDSLVDGDEYAAGTDPYNGNTDGDKRSDDIEVKAGTNPLAPDTQVTVVAQIFNDTGSQFTYNLSVRKPDQTGTGIAGLSATQSPVLNGNTNGATGVGKVTVHAGATGFVGHVFYGWFDPGGTTEHFTDGEGDLDAFQTQTYNPGLKGVPVGARFRVYESAVAGNTAGPSPDFIFTGSDTEASFNTGGTTLNHSLDFTGTTGDFALNQSFSFGLATGDHFSIEGSFTNTVTGQTVQLGGLSGVSAMQVDATSGSSKAVRTIFAYADVVTKFIEDFSFQVTMADGNVATLKFFYIVG